MPYRGNEQDYNNDVLGWNMTFYGDWMSKELWELVERAKPIVEADARMVADLTRFAPLPSEAQEQHDTTEYPSEKWLSDLEAFKKKWMIK